MTHQQLFSINRVQSIAAADRQEVTELAARLVDDLEHEKDIKDQLAVCIDKLTVAAEVGELSLLSCHIREIGLMVLNTDAQHSLQLACLLLQTVDHLAECDQLSEQEIAEELRPLLNEFKQSLVDYADAELHSLSDSKVSNGPSISFSHYALDQVDESISIPVANDFESSDADEDYVDLEENPHEMNMDIDQQIAIIDQALQADQLDALPYLPVQDIDGLLNEINNAPEFDLETSLQLHGYLNPVITALDESQPEFNRIAYDMLRVTGDAFNPPKSEYRHFLLHITSVADAYELTGLVSICKIIEMNLDKLEVVNSDVAHLLSNWVAIVKSHLQDPVNDQLCLNLCEYFEHASWPITLTHRQQRELLAGLTQTAEVSGDASMEYDAVEITAESVSLEIAEDANEELVRAFMMEAPDHAEKLSILIDKLIRLKDYKAIHEVIAAAQRIAHTIKGSSHLVGILGTANIAHQLEDILEFLDLHSIIPSQKLCSDLIRSTDELQSMMEYLQGKSDKPVDSLHVLSSLVNWSQLIKQNEIGLISASDSDESITIADSPQETITKKEITQSFTETHQLPISSDDIEPMSSATESDKSTLVANDTIRVSRALLDNIFNLVGETSIAIEQMQEQLKRLGVTSREMIKQDQTLQLRRFDLENAVSVKGLSMKQAKNSLPGSDDFDSLELDHYDEFYGVAHSFIEVVNDSRTALKGLSQEIKTLDGLALGQKRLNSELQDLVISTRLEPVKSLSSRLTRCVRQACRMSGKSAELMIIGEQLMMDGDMLKQLADPLMHMLRNAVDHGIESVEERVRAGKNSSGKITLDFYQQGSHILVRCMDDGRGLDYSAIRQKAIANGMLEESDQVDEKILSRLILKSGFSTRDVANQLSGRGIGLDVVYNTINNLKGSMDLGNNSTGGACITLKLPITLLTHHSLLVSTTSGRYAIPSTYLEQILSPGIGNIIQMAGKRCYKLKEEIYSLVSLEELISGHSTKENYSDSTILLVQGETEKIAVAIDKALASSELVVKSLGRYVQHINSVSGMSLLGDGRLIAVLNLPYLLAQFQTGRQVEKPVAKTNEPLNLIKVLIVDDSLSVRSSLSQLMMDAGYQPLLARDGIEAMDIIEKDNPQVVLTDLEMPRMNGLELASYIRKGQHKRLPVIMITSRNMQKHRQQAMQIGINQYLTKPFEEDALLTSIQMQLEQFKNAS